MIIEMCIDMFIDMRAGMCTDMHRQCIDIRIHIQMDMCINMRRIKSTGRCTAMRMEGINRSIHGCRRIDRSCARAHVRAARRELKFRMMCKKASGTSIGAS